MSDRMTPERRWWIENMCNSKEMTEVLAELDAVNDELATLGRDAGKIIDAYDRALRALDDGANDLPTRTLEARYREARAALEAALVSAGRRPK